MASTCHRRCMSTSSLCWCVTFYRSNRASTTCSEKVASQSVDFSHGWRPDYPQKCKLVAGVPKTQVLKSLVGIMCRALQGNCFSKGVPLEKVQNEHSFWFLVAKAWGVRRTWECWRTRVTHDRRTVFLTNKCQTSEGVNHFRNRQSEAHSFCFSRKLNPTRVAQESTLPWVCAFSTLLVHHLMS